MVGDKTATPPTERIVLRCEICGESFVFEFNSPIAAKCIKCDSSFDARLQILKHFRREFEELAGQGE